MATEADLIQKFKDLNIPVGTDFEELIHEAFTGANLVDKVENHDSRIATVEDNLDATKGSIQSNTNAIEKNANAIKDNTSNITTKADDSKVVHKTGDEEISGSKTFDVAPIDKTTGNPYITKDGVPAVPDTLADTTKDANFTGKLQKSGIDVATTTDVTNAVSTATANMVESSKPTNFTAGLQSGGVDVATAADLKSVEDASWHMKRLPNVPVLKNISLLYQVDDTNKKMKIVLNGEYNLGATADDSTGLLIADFSDIIQGITAISMKNNTNVNGFYYYDQSLQQSPDVEDHVNIVFSGTKLYMNTGLNGYPILQISGADYLCLMYGSTISYTKLR